MTETAKIELSNEEDTLESIAIAFGAPMVSDKFREEVGQILENSEKYQGIFTLSDDSVTTDKLSVEKLQEQLNTAKKALTESKELLRDMNRECDGLSESEETLYNIISQALAAIGNKGGGDE